METRRGRRETTPEGETRTAAAAGAVLFAVTCFLPGIGLFWAEFDTPQFGTIGQDVLDGRVPYRDFHFEYPPFALPPIVLPALGSAGTYATLFKLFELACGAALVALVALCARFLRLPRKRVWAAVLYTAVAPVLLGPLVLVRFDLWATALAAAALALLLAGRLRGAGVATGVAGAAKLFPLLLALLDALSAWRTGGVARAARRLALAGGAFLAVLLPFAVAAPRGAASTALGQLNRALQIESLAGSALLAADRLGLYDATVRFGDGSYNLVGQAPDVLAAAQSVVQIGAVAAVLVLFARTRGSGADLTAAAAAVILAFAVFGKVLSPQYVLWPLPFVALASGRFGDLTRAAYAGALVLTHGFFPGRYAALVHLDAAPVWLLVVRNTVLVATAAAAVAIVVRRAESRR